MIPPGSYQLIGFMETGDFDDDDDPPAVAITASTKVGAVTLSTYQRTQRIQSSGGDGVFDFVDCGPITLPTTDVPAGSAAIVRLEIAVGPLETVKEGDTPTDSGSSFQEFYLIPLADDTTLNIFDCGGTGAATLGTANNRLWIDSADLATRGTPSAWMGTAENRTNAYHAAGDAMRWQPLSLKPPEVLLFMANSGGSGAVANLTYTPAWLGLAAE